MQCTIGKLRMVVKAMQSRLAFPISLIIRFILVALFPIQITLSSVVPGTQLSGFGMCWTFADNVFQIHLVSIIVAAVYAIPAILFCIHFKFSQKESYPIRAALLSVSISGILAIIGFLMPVDTSILELVSNWPVPVGYPVLLILLFIVFPSLPSLIVTTGKTIRSLETALLSMAFILFLVTPFIFLFSAGIYASNQIILSSGYITINFIRSGWTTESSILFLDFRPLGVFNPLLTIIVVLSMRHIFLCFMIAYLLERTSLTKTAFVGLVQEILLIILTYLLDVSTQISPYTISGTMPIPILLPLFLLLALIKKRVSERRNTPEDEIVTVPILTRFRYELKTLRSKLGKEKES